MRIGEYSVVSPTLRGYFVSRNGMLFRIKRCSTEMTQARAKELNAELSTAIKAGSNVLVPDFVNADDEWYAVVPYRTEVFGGLPRAYLRTLPEAAKKHMILLAVSAADTLSRAGIVHGSLNPDCFRITVTDSGVLCLTLEELQNVGCHLFEPLEIDRTSDYAAPEVRKGGKPTKASDAFSLALCIHEWLAGELPRCKNKESDLTKNSVWLSSAVPVWARGVLVDLLNEDAALRPDLSTVLTRLANGNEERIVDVYGCESDAKEDANLCALMLEEDPKLAKRYG